MLPGPTERLVPEAEGALEQDLDPHPCKEDEFFFKTRPNTEEMEEAISKFLNVIPALETDGFQQLHRQLAWLPLPNQKVVCSMGHDEAVDGGLMKTMSIHVQTYQYVLVYMCTYQYIL